MNKNEWNFQKVIEVTPEDGHRLFIRFDDGFDEFDSFLSVFLQAQVLYSRE